MSARLTPAELSAFLADHVDSLVPELWPAARKSGGYWQAGNAQGDTGSSCYLHRAGERAGSWRDAATGEFGDLLDLINCALFGGSDLPEAMRWASVWLGLDPNQPPAAGPRREPKPKGHDKDEQIAILSARSHWTPAQSIVGTPGETYLRGRAIALPLPPTLRYAPALLHYPTGCYLPALVAAISGPDQKVTAVQRIYLRPGGAGKALVTEPKLTAGRMLDGACRLASAGREIGLSEGIETGLSAMELYGLPVWAACGSRMDAIAVPDDVERVVIFADNGTAGARGAERAATAHERPGRVVEIKPPVSPFKDWNDVARARAAKGAAA